MSAQVRDAAAAIRLALAFAEGVVDYRFDPRESAYLDGLIGFLDVSEERAG